MILWVRNSDRAPQEGHLTAPQCLGLHWDSPPLTTVGAPFSIQPLHGWLGLPHIAAASKFWDVLSEGSEL